MINVNDKQSIEDLYRRGIDAVRITKRLEKRYNVDTVRRYIQRNLKHLKEIHEKEKENTRQILKKTKWECGQEISSLEFVKRNLSIYKENRSGDWIVNKKVAPVITFDTPKKMSKKLEFS